MTAAGHSGPLIGPADSHQDRAADDHAERGRYGPVAAAGVPAAEVAGELVVKDAGADLQQQVGAARGPAHLLSLTMRLL